MYTLEEEEGKKKPKKKIYTFRFQPFVKFNLSNLNEISFNIYQKTSKVPAHFNYIWQSFKDIFFLTSSPYRLYKKRSKKRRKIDAGKKIDFLRVPLSVVTVALTPFQLE